MNWAMDWASSLDHIWRSPNFPMWLTLAAAGFFGLIVLITLLRAEKSVANGALTVITLLSIAVAVAATFRAFPPGGRAASADVPFRAAGRRVAAGIGLHRRTRRRRGTERLREDVIRLRRFCRRRRGLCGLRSPA